MIKKDEFEKDMATIDQNLRQLTVLYEDYFALKIYREPKELRAQTEALIQKWRVKPVVRAASRFKLQNLIQRYNAFKEKWDRQLRIKEKEEREW